MFTFAYSQIQKMRKTSEIEEKYTFEGDSHGARKKKFGNLKLHKITVQLISLPLETTSTPLRYYPPSTSQEVLKFGYRQVWLVWTLEVENDLFRVEQV